MGSTAAQNVPQALQSLPSSLIDQLNRVQQPTTPYDSALPQLSPLDQVRLPQNQLPTQSGTTPMVPLPLQSEVQPLAPPSQLERDYSRRAGMPLRQYGYDVFRTIIPSRGQLETGAVADNYRLSIGDELVITLQGQVSRSVRTRVDSEGRVVIADMPPVAAAGRTFGEVRHDIEAQVAATFLNTNVFVSVGTVRQISVTVLGEAGAPGIYRMGGFGTVLDALAMARGIKKSGSLRRIVLTRGDRSTTIDLYTVMAGTGPAPDLTLADGDRLMIPPVGPTVAVVNEVGRPGIYEIGTGGVIGGQQLLALGGGPLRPSGNRFVKMSLDARGRDVTTETRSVAATGFRAGDILMVLPGDDLPVGSVRLDGHVRVPGVRSLAVAPDVRQLIGSDDAFLDDPYLLFGVIETTDALTRARRLVPVDLAAVMQGRARVPLKDGDTVIVLGVGDVNYLASADVQAVLQGKRPPLLVERIVTQNPRANFVQRAPAPSAETENQLLGAETIPGLMQEGEAGQAGKFAGLLPNLNTPARTQPAQAGPVTPGGTGLQPSFDKDAFAEQSAQICRGLQQLATIASTARPGRFTNAIYSTTSMYSAAPGYSTTSPSAAVAGGFAGTGAGATVDDSHIENVFPCPAIFDKYPDLLPLLVEHAASVTGEVRIPGPYPILPNTPLSLVVDEAGGIAREADLQRVEITHYAIDAAQDREQTDRQLIQVTRSELGKVALSPGDVVRFNPIYSDRDDGVVTLTGEFRRPGTYDITRGERLSQVIARAGGLAEDAYPYGAVFTRQSVRDEEARQYAVAAQRVESALPTLLARAAGTDQSQAAVQASQQMINALHSAEPVGRIVVEADPTVLEVKPQLDPVMAPGDMVFMPKRPLSVAVAGEVLNPTSLQFKSGASPVDYIAEAGGYTQAAERSAAYLVLPNGQAQSIKVSFWDFTPIQVPPGSTIVVPRNLEPFDLTTFLKDSTQIFSQLAISAASLAVIHSNSTR